MKKIFSLFALATLSLTLAAQDFKTGYFLDNYVYGYRLNPALTDDNTKTVVGVVVGDLSIAPSSTVGLSQFLFPYNGSLIWGFNDNVSSSEFLGGLPDMTKLGARIDMSLLNLGFNTKVGYFTFDARLRSNTQASVCKSLFGYMKDGFDLKKGAQYNFSQLDLSNKEYLEVAIGYSRRIESLKIGGTVKVLAGLASVNAQLNNLNVKLVEDNKVSLTGQSELSLASPMVNVPKTSDGLYDFEKVTAGNPGVSGFGAAVDLGVHWDAPVNGLSVDAAVLDLGFMRWGNAINGSASYAGQEFSLSNQNSNEMINKIFGLNANKETNSGMEMLSATVNAGVRYKMPFYNKLSVGAHGSFVLGHFSSYDARIGATVTPVNAVSIAVNGGVNSFGSVFGVAANFRLGPIALFAGVDNLVTRFNPQGIPLNPLNTTVKFGLTIAVK